MFAVNDPVVLPTGQKNARKRGQCEAFSRSSLAWMGYSPCNR